jgi:hypothetical protein
MEFLILAGLLAIAECDQPSVFEQDFNAGGVPGDYVGTGANQFNGITSSNFTWSINSNALQMASTATGAAALTITNLPVLGAAIIQFTVNLKSITALGGFITLTTGSGFDTSVAKPSSTNAHDFLTINFKVAGTSFINQSGTQSASYAGPADAFWVVNNSGATMTYMAPDFTKQTVGNDKYDLWVGTNLVFDEAIAVNFVPITGIKISQAGGSSVSTFDNFKITGISQQKVGLTEYLYDGFADGNMTANPAWANLSGTAVVTNDSGSNALLFTGNSTRYSAPVPALVSGKATIKYRVKKTGPSNAAGLYLVDASGAGYGFITDLNDAANQIDLKMTTTADSGATDTFAAGNGLSGPSSNDWHTVAVLWDIDAGTFKFYIDGTPVGVTLTNTIYSTFTKVIVYGKYANTVLMDDIQINQTPESIVTELSWYTPLGLVVNKTGWGGVSNGNYNYQLQKESGIRNYPFPPDGVIMPTNAPAVGSDAYYDLQYQAALKSDLPKMKKSGFDVAVFDMQTDPQYNPALPLDGINAPLVHYKTFLKWINAAEQVGGIKVGLFPQNAGSVYTNSIAEWVKCLKGALDNLPDSDAVWKIDNKPVMMMFGNWQDLKDQGAAPCYGWKDVISSLRATHPFYFIVDTNPSITNYGEWSELADAGYCFGPAGPSGWLTDTNTDGQMYMLNLFATQKNYPAMSFYPISSPGYYRADSKVRAYTQPDFYRIHAVYISALDAGAERIHVLTWNDFGEDTDIMPSANKTSALLDVYSFYNTWLKTAIQPSAQDENITIAYPLHIPDTVLTPPVNWDEGRISPPFLKTAAPNTGRVFYWANVKTAQTLQVNSLTTVNLPAGLSMGEIANGISTGAVTVTLNGSLSTNVLPAIDHISVEGNTYTNGGLQFHYIRVK